MLVELRPQQLIPLETPLQRNKLTLIGLLGKQLQLVPIPQMGLDSVTCTAMCGNGVSTIGMKIMTALLLMGAPGSKAVNRL